MRYRIIPFFVFWCAVLIMFGFVGQSESAYAPVLAEELQEEPSVEPPKEPQPAFAAPIENPWSRVSKKPFGIHVTPDSSPVPFDIFNGYHTGVDFEVFKHEHSTPVPIFAICSGRLLYKGWIKGYGGVAIQKCMLEDDPVTVVYGHMKLASVTARRGEYVASSDTIGILGRGFSKETDGRRKHLHLGVHRGTAVNFKGYIDNKYNLEEWVDILHHID